MIETSPHAHSSDLYVIGESAEVWCTFTNRWSDGYTVEKATAEGVLLRRDSDWSVLPTTLPMHRVRPARGQAA